MGSGLRMNAQRLDCVVDNTEVVGQLDRAAGEVPCENRTQKCVTVPLLEACRLDRVTEAFLRRLLPGSHLGDAPVRPAFVLDNSLSPKQSTAAWRSRALLATMKRAIVGGSAIAIPLPSADIAIVCAPEPLEKITSPARHESSNACGPSRRGSCAPSATSTRVRHDSSASSSPSTMACPGTASCGPTAACPRARHSGSS